MVLVQAAKTQGFKRRKRLSGMGMPICIERKKLGGTHFVPRAVAE